MNKRLIKFLTFAIFLIAANPVFSQTEIPIDSLWNKNSVLTKKEIHASAKTGLYSLLLIQPGFIQNKKTMTFRGLSWDYTKIELDGLDIKDPFSGELAFDPVLQTLDNITINDNYASGKVTLTSNQDFSVLHSSAGYLFDGFDPGKNTRGMQSFFAAVSGPILNWQSLSFAATAKRTSSKSLWLNGEPVAEYFDGVNVSNIPMNYVEFNAQNNNYDIRKDTMNISYPAFRNGSERTQYDFSGLLIYKNDIFSIIYQVLGQTASGRIGILPNNKIVVSNIFALENRTQFEQNSQLHQLTFSQDLTNQLKYSISGAYFSKYYSEYDPTFKDNVLAYGDPEQNSNYVYGIDGNIWIKKTNYNSFGELSFSTESDIISGFVKRKQNYFEIKGSAEYQFDDHLNFSAGFKNRNYEVRNLVFNPTSLKNRQNYFQQQVIRNPDHYKSSDFINYAARSIGADNYGYDVFGNESNDEFSGGRKPSELNYYGNVDYTLEILKVNAQLNYQVMNLGSKKLKGTVYQDYLYNLTSESYINTGDEKNIGYNVKIFLPIQENLQFFGNISRENILPPAADYNSGLAYVSNLLNGGFSNSAISYDPKSLESKTINIGMNFSYQDQLFMTGKFFVNEIRNLPQIRQILIMKDSSPLNFYGNSQNGTQTYKGIEAQMKTSRWNYFSMKGNLNYSLNGSGGSSPNSQFRTVWVDSSNPVGSESEISFSGADEYQYNLGFDFHANQEHEFVEDINEFGFNFSIQGNSGHPYTRISGYTSTSGIPTESVNSSKTPNFTTYDLSCDLGFSLSNLNGLVYIKVENLANKKAVYDVFTQSGSAENDGYLNSTQGKSEVANLGVVNGAKFTELYNALNNQNHPEFFGSPRTVTFGVKLDF